MPIEVPSLDQLAIKHNIPDSDKGDIFFCLLLLVVDREEFAKEISKLPMNSQKLVMEVMLYSIIESKREERKKNNLRKALGKFGE